MTVRSLRSGLPRHRVEGFLTLVTCERLPSRTVTLMVASLSFSQGVSGKKSDAKYLIFSFAFFAVAGWRYDAAAAWRIVLFPEPFSPQTATIGNSKSMRSPRHPLTPSISIDSSLLGQPPLCHLFWSSLISRLMAMVPASSPALVPGYTGTRYPFLPGLVKNKIMLDAIISRLAR